MTSKGSAVESKTLALTVRNPGFLLDRLGQDCHPLQFLRELSQNAFEATSRTPEMTGEVVWDVDWTSYDLNGGPYKLCVTDNGDGMTGDEMVKYINQLSSSLSEQSIHGNFGVGAKIAAATRNHAGLIYLSWKNGEGSMIHLWRDPDSGDYGLRQLRRPDGSYGHFAAVEDAVRPELIKEHGTMIVLLGNDETDDTMKAPEGSPAPSRWIAKYLNSRFFQIPPQVSIRAREGWEYPRADRDRNLLRRITGQEDYLKHHAECGGDVLLSGSTARWWILKEETALTQNSGFIESSGHVAALYKSELYELATARSGTAMLQRFGVLLGARRVVLYVEPALDADQRVTTNTARTQLLVNNLPLPWTEWAAEFRENMPSEIEALMDQVAAGSTQQDQSSSIKERLKDILDLYRVSRYRVAVNGDLMIDESRRTRGGESQERDPKVRQRGGRSGTPGGSAGGVYSVFLKKDGTPGRAVRPDVFPDIMWVSLKDGTRDPGDIEDRAARFLVDQNNLRINADFRVFTDMIDRWTKEYGGKPGVADVVTESVRGWFAQALVETVIGIQALKDSKEWSIEDIEKALSEEGLTAAVMSRYHVNNSVKRELGTRLGKLVA